MPDLKQYVNNFLEKSDLSKITESSEETISKNVSSIKNQLISGSKKDLSDIPQEVDSTIDSYLSQFLGKKFGITQKEYFDFLGTAQLLSFRESLIKFDNFKYQDLKREELNLKLSEEQIAPLLEKSKKQEKSLLKIIGIIEKSKKINQETLNNLKNEREIVSRNINELENQKKGGEVKLFFPISTSYKDLLGTEVDIIQTQTQGTKAYNSFNENSKKELEGINNILKQYEKIDLSKMSLDLADSKSKKLTGNLQNKFIEKVKENLELKDNSPNSQLALLEKIKEIEQNKDKFNDQDIAEILNKKDTIEQNLGNYYRELSSSDDLEHKSKEALDILKSYHKQKYLASSQEEFLSKFLEDSINNKKVNSYLGELEKSKNKIYLNAHSDDIYELKRWSFKTKNIENFTKILNKLENNVEKINSGQSLSYEEQITPKEFGILTDLAGLNKMLIKFNEYKVIREGSKLKELLDQSNSAKNIVKTIQNKFIEEQQYKDGDIVMYNSDIQNQFSGKNPKLFSEEWLTRKIVGKYGHAAQINISEDDTPKLSHVYGNYENKEIGFQQAMFSDIYRFDASKLLTKEGIEKAQETFGENWQEEINKIYQNSQSEVYEKGAEERFDSLKNSEQKRFESGKADFMFHGHKTKEEQDFKELSEKFYQRDGAEVDDNIMICSEFVTRSTIASLVKSNEELSEKLGINNSLQIPFSKYEDLNKVHTQRLIDILMEKECITQVRKPNIEIMLFKEPEKAQYKTIMNMTKIVEDQLKVFEDSVMDNQLPGQKHEKSLRLTESLIDKFVETYNKNNPYDAIEISPK
ncbi:hypothetical protein [Rickettsiales endosymbiont of Trichoplax sp. H2]|uniref:hypothetical protein n=1 Tax=Rickettsiales endosymbiont of Trichoplax sp. H2 TaxID=2021221 RepID=UPI0012B2F923|nr:hypothetical protein [Rickettsiales endosymbiont of Trichoplax sp. H2]MSO14234.1 hypothetical protein [Rickettsiales endosymbiont of Trichoplax sp. H2]